MRELIQILRINFVVIYKKIEAILELFETTHTHTHTGEVDKI